ncbi:Putative integral membrane protein DUF46 [Dokdonella immobilis]|uniref:Putative integral membrane protein DUF46 n=1 Tax=Dokdonella immobilis TaxID=578942 RepID=A0A1I4ZBM8_9GAMM|nr:Putative integral membrane protein DUF46 [Dokdonella immobilis]
MDSGAAPGGASLASRSFGALIHVKPATGHPGRDCGIVTDLLRHALALAYLMAPAYLANMAPPFVRYWRGWNRPIHARLLGTHKTVVGAALGIAVALLATAVQAAVSGLPVCAGLARVDYRYWPLLGLGFGVGSMAGDSIKSLFKRRLKIAPGAPWVPFDQLDFALGSLLLVGPWAKLSVTDMGLILAVTFVGDLAVNRMAFRLGIKRSPW